MCRQKQHRSSDRPRQSRPKAADANRVQGVRTECRPCCCPVQSRFGVLLRLIGCFVPLRMARALARLLVLAELLRFPRGRSRHKHHRAHPRFERGCNAGQTLEKTDFRDVVERNRVQKVCEKQCRIRFDPLGVGLHPAALSHCPQQW
jgi:hypothetical protein